MRTRPGFLDILVKDLRPFDGRLGAAMRMSLCCILVVAFAMSHHVPEAAVSCYLIFFASRDNAASGILISIALVVGASVGILLGLVFLQTAVDHPGLRIALIALFTFVGMYFSLATKAGPIAATIGFVFAFVMTLYDFVTVPELLSRGISWMWVVIFVPMAVLLLVNVLMGPNPARLVRRRIAQRLRSAGALLHGEARADARAQELLADDVVHLVGPARPGALLGYLSKDAARRLAAIMPMAQTLLAEARVASKDVELAQRLDALAEDFEEGCLPPPDWQLIGSLPATEPLGDMAARIMGIWIGRTPIPPPSAPQKAAARDTFSNPAYAQFAVKTLLAVMITYTLYTAGGWFEIHTAMITCFYVALGTTGETLHKAALRMIGCLVGAAMGIGSILFLMPHMTDIGHLLLLVGAGSFVAAWVAQGSSLIQYMGWQAALAFFICVLQGYGPSFDIAVATNRVLGILFGNAVVTIVFLWLWPTSVATLAADHLSKAVEHLRAAFQRNDGALALAGTEFANARRFSQLWAFEPSRLHAKSPMLPHANTVLNAGEAVNKETARLLLLQQRRHYLVEAPRHVKTAVSAQGQSIAAFLKVVSSSIEQPDGEARIALHAAFKRTSVSLERLETLLSSAQGDVAWRRDLEDTVIAHRALALIFSEALETI